MADVFAVNLVTAVRVQNTCTVSREPLDNGINAKLLGSCAKLLLARYEIQQQQQQQQQRRWKKPNQREQLITQSENASEKRGLAAC